MNKLWIERRDRVAKARDAQPNFIRQDNFRLTPSSTPQLADWISGLDVDLNARVIDIYLQEDVSFASWEWVNRISTKSTEETLKLEHIDVYGNTVKTVTFSGLKVVGHKESYGHDSDGTLTHCLLITFKNAEIL